MSDAAAPSAISAVADRGQVRLGEPFRVAIEVRHDVQLRYDLSPSQAPGPFAILGGGCATRAGSSDGETRCDVDLALLDLGVHSATIRLQANGSRPVALDVRASPVRALPVTDPSVAASAIPLRGLPPPVPLFVPTWEPVAWIAVGVAIALAVAVLVVRRLREHARRAPRRADPRALPPSEAFEERLGALESGADAATAGAFFGLSRALREYLAALSPAATLDLTSAEVLAAVRRAPIGGLDPGRLGAALAELDRVKFGGAPVDDAAWTRAVQSARAILESTRPPRWHPDREVRRA